MITETSATTLKQKAILGLFGIEIQASIMFIFLLYLLIYQVILTIILC